MSAKKAILEALNNPNNTKTIFEIHNEVYAPLKACETLDEAKALFPEFINIKQASEIEQSPTLKKIAEGKIEGLTMDNMAITFLKKFFVDVTGKNRANEWFNLSGGTISKLAEQLKIPRAKNPYLAMYKSGDKNVRDKISAGEKNYFEKNSQAAKKRSETMYKHHKEHPEIRLCASLAYQIHSDLKEKMQLLAKEEFPGLGNIRKKQCTGIKLSEAEKKYRKRYYSEVNRRYAKEVADLGETRKILLKEIRTRNGAILNNSASNHNYE